MSSFTVVVPTHQRRETVLLAVRSLLRQTRPPEQILVVCDGCTDGTGEAVRTLDAPTVTVLELAKGPGYAYGHRNVALERVTGDAVIWLGDDDLLLPEHLARVADRWEAGDVDVVTVPAVIVYPDDALLWFGRDWSVPYVREWLRRENTHVMGSVCARTALLRQVGGWDATLPRAADWDLWKRIADVGARSAMLPDPTVLHFRATGRSQEWAARVRQNTSWSDRIADPTASGALHAALHRTRSVAEAALLEERTTVVEHLQAVNAHVADAERRVRVAESRAEAAEHRLAEAERLGAASRSRGAPVPQTGTIGVDERAWRERVIARIAATRRPRRLPPR